MVGRLAVRHSAHMNGLYLLNLGAAGILVGDNVAVDSGGIDAIVDGD